jgi:ribonuclease-3
MKPSPDIGELARALGHDFADPALLRQALTHSSAINEKVSGVAAHNERLEFLGDAVLELAVSAELWRRYANAREGQLTSFRAMLVREPSLAELARSLGVPDYLNLGRGEEAQGGRERDALLADAMEAIIGAIFVDGGFAAAQTVVLRLFAERWPERLELPKPKDFKTRLQEATQKLHKRRPIYTQLSASGPEHEKIYEVLVELPDGRDFTGRGKSLKKAQQDAARVALDHLDQADAPGETP